MLMSPLCAVPFLPVARRDVHAALTAADGADALAQDDAFLINFVPRGLPADGEADAAAAQQATFFLFFQLVVAVGLGRRANLHIAPGPQTASRSAATVSSRPAMGFTTGQKIEVITGPGQLIIRLADV